MNPQIITTGTGEELVVLPRRDYDALRARAGDEDAEDRMTVLIAQEARRRLASGEDRLVEAGPNGRPPNLDPPLGVRIREARKARKMGQIELAKAAEIGQGYLSEIERGEKTPGDEVLARLARALGLELAG
jgi:ribosome-binding protein aMBF1 (putative translation factor)